MRPYEAVLFDMDGTLADTIPDLLAVFNAILAAHGAPALTRESIVPHFGPTEEGMLVNLLPGVPDMELRAELAAQLAGRGPVPTFDGMRALVAACKAAGARVGVFTGAGRLYGGSRLARMDLAGLVDAFVAADEVPATKPDPAGLVELCRRLAVGPETSVYVGDSPLDLQCAHRAGVTAVGVTWGVHGRERLAQENPAALVATPLELAAFLGLD
jgi:phosphoglycolate phosphatase-like HAD superfamily hydrolase